METRFVCFGGGGRHLVEWAKSVTLFWNCGMQEVSSILVEISRHRSPIQKVKINENSSENKSINLLI